MKRGPGGSTAGQLWLRRRRASVHWHGHPTVWRLLASSLGAALLLWLAARWLQARAAPSLRPLHESTPLLGATRVVARLECDSGPGGGERLRGETRFELPGRGVFALVSEEAELDPTGRLARALVRVVWRRVGGSGESVELSSELRSFDAREELFASSSGRDPTRTRRIAADLPWSYLSLATPEGHVLSTPVAAIIARRAAEVSSAVRRIDPFGHDASLASDQILVPDGDDVWVVLGDDLAVFARASASRHGLVRLHLAPLDLDIAPPGL